MTDYLQLFLSLFRTDGPCFLGEYWEIQGCDGNEDMKGIVKYF